MIHIYLKHAFLLGALLLAVAPFLSAVTPELSEDPFAPGDGSEAVHSRYEEVEPENAVTSTGQPTQALREEWNSLYGKMIDAPPDERVKLHDELLETVTSMAINLVMFPDGGTDLDADRSAKVMIDLLETIFLGEQAALKRAAGRPNEREEALGLMKQRTRSFLSLYPIGNYREDRSNECNQEVMVLSLYLARAYNYIPEYVSEIVRNELPRWQKEQRVPGLLVLAAASDEDARAELDDYTSEAIRCATATFRHIVGRGEMGR